MIAFDEKPIVLGAILWGGAACGTARRACFGESSGCCGMFSGSKSKFDGRFGRDRIGAHRFLLSYLIVSDHNGSRATTEENQSHSDDHHGRDAGGLWRGVGVFFDAVSR